LLPEISAPPPYLGQDYEHNGFGEKRGRVRLNRLSGRQMGGRYGARKAEIGQAFQKERESAGVERSRISRGFGKKRKDRGIVWHFDFFHSFFFLRFAQNLFM